MGKENPEENELEEELEALYHKVASEKDLFSQLKESTMPEGMTLPHSSVGPPSSQEIKKQKFIFSIIAPSLILFTLLLILMAVLFGSTIYHYDAIDFGGRIYPQIINRPVGKSVLVPPVEDTKLKIQTEKPPIIESLKTTNRKKYAIQIRAYPETDKNAAMVFVTDLRKKQPDISMERVYIHGQGAWYRILLGQFTTVEEASAYMKEKKVLKVYPGSFVQLKAERRSSRLLSE